MNQRILIEHLTCYLTICVQMLVFDHATWPNCWSAVNCQAHRREVISSIYRWV